MTEQELIVAVRDLVEKYPDNKYLKFGKNGDCYYNQGQNSLCPNPGCIFGQILPLKGDNPIEDVIFKHIPDLSQITLKWCQKIQALQDRDSTWAQALNVADQEMLTEF